MTITLVEGMSTYRAGRKRKRPRGEGKHTSKRRKGAAQDTREPTNDIVINKNPTLDQILNAEDQIEPPSILQHLTTGINEVTRALEAQLAATRTPVTISTTSNTSSSDNLQIENNSGSTSTHISLSPKIKLIFICRADIDPGLLIAHIPPLVATHNAIARVENAIKLVPLPRGAEASLGDALGLRRVAVLAINEAAEGLSLFQSLLPSVPTLTAPWRAPTSTLKLAPTRVKQVLTSAPKDLKAAKEERAKGKKAARLKAQGEKGAKGRVVVHGVPGAPSTSNS